MLLAKVILLFQTTSRNRPRVWLAILNLRMADWLVEQKLGTGTRELPQRCEIVQPRHAARGQRVIYAQEIADVTY
jgi:hypothetical protein